MSKLFFWGKKLRFFSMLKKNIWNLQLLKAHLKVNKWDKMRKIERKCPTLHARVSLFMKCNNQIIFSLDKLKGIFAFAKKLLLKSCKLWHNKFTSSKMDITACHLYFLAHQANEPKSHKKYHCVPIDKSHFLLWILHFTGYKKLSHCRLVSLKHHNFLGVSHKSQKFATPQFMNYASRHDKIIHCASGHDYWLIKKAFLFIKEWLIQMLDNISYYAALWCHKSQEDQVISPTFVSF